MDFQFFENLSADEAQAFLKRFLELESSNIGGLLQHCSREGVHCDFSTESVAPFLRWVVPKLTPAAMPPDPQVPEWIRNTESYRNNLFDFDEPSKMLILRAAYYLGESFVRSYSQLRWTVGDPETAEGNMPVVTGFRAKLEMAPMLVSENLFRRVVAEPAKLGDIDIALASWIDKI